MTLRISLLGPPQVSRVDGAATVPGHRPLALLAYLLLTARAHSREHLVDLFFDGPADPRAALRWTLHQLRKGIGAEAILADRQEIGFNFATDYWLDVDAFEDGVLDLYRGELLAGIDLRDAHQYTAWLLVERERLRARYETGLVQRLQAAHMAGDPATAEETALRLLEMDNLREDWHRALMSAYAGQGKFEAAGAHYALCRQILQQELGGEPAPETAALAAEIEQQQAEHYRAVAARSRPALSLLDRIRSPVGRHPTTPDPAAAEIRRGAGSQRGRSWRSLVIGTTLLLLGILLFIALDWNRLATEPAAGTDLSGDSPSAANLAGTTVTIGSVFDLALEPFSESLSPLEAQTGITVEMVRYDSDYEQIILSIIRSGLKPDILLIPQPGLVADLVRQGLVVDVRTFLEDDFLRHQYSEALLEAAEIEGQMAGIWFNAQVKSLVWYPKRAFDAADYTIPETWEELLALTEQISADGHTPWCIGIEHGEASGWIGTDWIENILLRTAPTETYDAWTTGDLPFDSPEIRRAFALMGEIWLEDRYVYGGTPSISSQEIFASYEQLFAKPPGCFLHQLGSFAPFIFPEDAIDGQDYDVFYLPPIDEAYGRPVLGSGDLAVMLEDRPEVRAVMRYLATGDSVRRLVEEGFFISPHKDARFEWYASPSQLKVAQFLLEADTYRFDASDLMPPEVGTGTFWQGIVAWVDGEDLDAVLPQIDESWPERD